MRNIITLVSRKNDFLFGGSTFAEIGKPIKFKIYFSFNKFQTIKTTITMTTIIAIYIPGEHMDSSIPDGQSSYELQTS